MCTTCGCPTDGFRLSGQPLTHGHASDGERGRDPGHRHHDSHHDHRAFPDVRSGNGMAAGHDEGNPRKAARLIQVQQDVLSENQRYAAGNRRLFRERGILAINLLSGPGAGKTTMLVRMIEDLRSTWPIAVVEGDQETAFDADRVRAAGVPAVQINTGKGCHLDARMVAGAMADLNPIAESLLVIENVGNLVCPAAFDLGEALKIVLLSVTEGEDKPLKYAEMFAAADVMLLTKIDLLPFLSFDRERCCGYARRINPEMEIFEVSASTGEGLGDWYRWLAERRGVDARSVAGNGKGTGDAAVFPGHAG